MKLTVLAPPLPAKPQETERGDSAAQTRALLARFVASDGRHRYRGRQGSGEIKVSWTCNLAQARAGGGVTEPFPVGKGG